MMLIRTMDNESLINQHQIHYFSTGEYSIMEQAKIQPYRTFDICRPHLRLYGTSHLLFLEPVTWLAAVLKPFHFVRTPFPGHSAQQSSTFDISGKCTSELAKTLPKIPPPRLQGSNTKSLAQPHILKRCLRVFLHIPTGLVTMARNINARTLFHLVPLNQLARDALLLPENSSYVSPSHASASDVQLGLEIGFHVPLKPAGRVITRLGRDADLILPERHISAIHIAFEIHPDTLVTLLSVRSKRSSQVIVQSIEGNADRVEGDCVLLYGQNYTIRIVHYEFQLIWRNAATVESLRALVAQEYRNSLQRLQFVRPRDLPTDIGSELHTWHQTRLHTAKRILFREAEGEPRTLIGQGRFGDVFRAVDLESGNAIAVKVVRLSSYPNVELARVALHREIKALEKLKHVRYIVLAVAAI